MESLLPGSETENIADLANVIYGESKLQITVPFLMRLAPPVSMRSLQLF